MRLMQVVSFIENVTGVPTYPLEFPYNDEAENVLVVDIINGEEEAGVTEINIQIMTRSIHPSTAETLGYDTIQTLHNLTDMSFEGIQVILIKATNPNPFYNGLDKNNKYIYTTDFRILTTQ